MHVYIFFGRGGGGVIVYKDKESEFVLSQGRNIWDINPKTKTNLLCHSWRRLTDTLDL